MLEILTRLSGSELRAVAQGLRSGRLCPPFSSLAMQSYCSAPVCADLVSFLKKLAGEGMKPEHMALIFDAAIQTRGPAGTDTNVELVWTGHNAKGASDRDTGVVVRELFTTAQRDVLIACFAVYQGEALFQILAERMDNNPNLRVRMFLNIARGWNDTSDSSQIVCRYAADFKTKHWSGKRLPEIYYDPRALSVDTKQRANLHAKSIVIDGHTSFVSSANFTEAAQLRNIELGVVIRSEPIAGKISGYFEAMLSAGALLPLRMN
ncbi:MAG: DISARM system phospholipase D-like protein DrmC [Planctomycetota bacterium]